MEKLWGIIFTVLIIYGGYSGATWIFSKSPPGDLGLVPSGLPTASNIGIYQGYESVSEGADYSIQDLSGTYTVEACSSNSGNCYDLDADVSNGSVQTIHFDNGGYLDVDAQLDENGDGSGSSYNGDEWEIHCADCVQ